VNRYARKLTTLAGHTHAVTCLVVLPEGKLASACWDKTILIWDITTGLYEAELREHDDAVITLAVLPGDMLASGSHDTTIRIWNISTQDCEIVLRGHESYVSSLAVVSNKLISGGWDRSIRVWDLTTYRCEMVFPRYIDIIFSLFALSSGKLASCDIVITIWNVSEQTSEKMLRGHSHWVSDMAEIPDGRLISGSWDCTVRIWDISIGRCDFVLEGHLGPINSIVMFPNGKLVTGSDDQEIRIWEISVRQCEVILKGTDKVRSVCALPGGALVSGASDGKIHIWDVGSRGNAVDLSEICSSPLFKSGLQDCCHARNDSSGRTWVKRVVNAWYNVTGIASWVHRLRDHYKSHARISHVLQINTACSKIDFDQYFVNLALIRHVEHVAREQGLVLDTFSAQLSLQRGELYDQLFVNKSYCTVDSIFEDLSDRGRKVGWIKIVGRAGTGKTTLTHYLAHRWSKKDSLWDNRFDAVFQIKLNLLAQNNFFEPGGDSASDLVALVHASLDRSSRLDRNTIAWFLGSQSLLTLILLDGFDEISTLYLSNSRIRNVVNHALSLPNGILTSRPIELPTEWNRDQIFVRTFENIGLSEENVVTYVIRYFETNLRREGGCNSATNPVIGLTDSLPELLKRNPNLMRLAQIPVNLHALCGIWEETQRGHGIRLLTVTSLYDQIVLSVLRHHKIKQCATACKFELTSDFLRNESRDPLRVLSRLAYEAFEEGNIQILGADLIRQFFMERMNLLKLYREEWGLLRQAEVDQGIGSTGFVAHYFVHLTYQEYFVAIYFAESLLPRVVNESLPDRRHRLKHVQEIVFKIRERLHQQRYAVIWTFLAGLLSRSPYNEYADYYWDALLPDTREPSALNNGGNTSSYHSTGWLGVHSSSAIISLYGPFIREAIFVSLETGESLPRRLDDAVNRFKVVLQWQLLCRDRHLVSMGDEMTQSIQDIQRRQTTHEHATSQLLHDLRTMNCNITTKSPWKILPGYIVRGPINPRYNANTDLSLLESTVTECRLAGVRNLCQSTCPNTATFLQLQLCRSDKDESVRSVALVAWCLQVISTADTMLVVDHVHHEMITALKDPSAEMRRSAVMMLGVLALMGLVPKETERLNSVLTTDACFSVRLQCAKVLLISESSIQALHIVVASLTVSDIRVRLEALSVLKERVGEIMDVGIIQQLLEVLNIDHFTHDEQTDRAVILRRIRPEMYAAVDLSLVSTGPLLQGYVESMWLNIGNSLHWSAKLANAEEIFLRAVEETEGVAELIENLREPLYLPLVTSVFEESFVSEINESIVADDHCQGSANIPTSVAKLNRCCDTVDDDVSLNISLFGPGYSLIKDMCVPGISEGDVRIAVNACRGALLEVVALNPYLASIDSDHLVAIRLYTLKKPEIFKLLNYPFYNPNNRDRNLLRNQLPFMKYMLTSYDALQSHAKQLIYVGEAFRGMQIAISEYLKRKYRNWREEFEVGKKLTFPSFTSVSRSAEIAEQYAGEGERIIYRFLKVIGLSLSELSSEVEDEVLLRPPAVFIIREAAMHVNATLEVILEIDVNNRMTYI
jgi:WD40 repeat protein